MKETGFLRKLKGTLHGKRAARDWSSRPDEALFSKEAMEKVETAVSKLPESYRAVFHLRNIEGLSNGEAGEVLGLSVPAVKSRLHGAGLF